MTFKKRNKMVVNLYTITKSLGSEKRNKNMWLKHSPFKTKTLLKRRQLIRLILIFRLDPYNFNELHNAQYFCL